MPATAQQIIDAGFGMSRFSRPELAAVQAPALVKVVDRVQQILFQFAARVNPLAFSALVDVEHNGSGWVRPSNAEAVLRLEGRGAATTPEMTGEITVVPYDDRSAFVGQPSVFRLGTLFAGAGNAGDPTAGTLRFLIARRPNPIQTLADTTDPALPDTFLPIMEFEVAAFNARADGGRDGELELMVAERNRHIATFEAWLEHETQNETRRFGEIRRFATERRAPLDALVKAGS